MARYLTQSLRPINKSKKKTDKRKWYFHLTFSTTAFSLGCLKTCTLSGQLIYCQYHIQTTTQQHFFGVSFTRKKNSASRTNFALKIFLFSQFNIFCIKKNILWLSAAPCTYIVYWFQSINNKAIINYQWQIIL